MNKFKKLIEYVINDETAKAEELFHEIVVEKSRDIYESLIDDEDELGGDSTDEFMNDIEADDEGIDDIESDSDIEVDDEDFEADESDDADLEDRVVDLEDQLDALMAEFDAIMNDESDDNTDEEPEMDDELDVEEPEMEGMYENVSLTKVTKGLANSTEESSVNKRSVNADNSGKKGASAKAQMSAGEEGGRTAPSVKPGNGTTAPKQSPAPRPVTKTA